MPDLVLTVHLLTLSNNFVDLQHYNIFDFIVFQNTYPEECDPGFVPNPTYTACVGKLVTIIVLQWYFY